MFIAGFIVLTMVGCAAGCADSIGVQLNASNLKNNLHLFNQ